MDTTTLKKFAQGARRQLLEQVSSRMEQVLRTDSVEIREKARVVDQLRAEIEAHGKIAVMDKVAYIWFNRFCALRFMDVNHYTRIGAVSPAADGTQPEVLLEAKQGHVDEDLARFVIPQVIFSLLNGQRPASDPQGEAYRLLLVGVCNSYSEVMPFLFEKIEDYTELLMPLDLLSENSVLHTLRSALGAAECADVEVIGWLYQYYISERKDQVFEALKQNQKIEARDIPAATQLFTPHWIVRYLVENSLGRLWLLNHPNSALRERMEYYIEPVGSEQSSVISNQLSVGSEQSVGEDTDNCSLETDYLHISSPEDLKLLDPACGSGHILTYAFDLLYAIYEEEGYAPADIARLILEKNIFGVEIDPRAGALAAFALVMKARAKDRRLFTRSGRDVNPNICVLENVTFTDAELQQYSAAVGGEVESGDLFTEPLMETLRQFEQADNFGSLIRPMLSDVSYVRGLLKTLRENLGGDLFLFGVHERVLKVLKQAEFLAPRYHVVVANPPYMGRKGMNEQIKVFTEEYYEVSSSDTYSAFIDRSTQLIGTYGYSALITMDAWMFSPAFEEFRLKILRDHRVINLAHFGPRAFDSISGEIVSTAAFIIDNKNGSSNNTPVFINATSGNNEAEKSAILRDKKLLFSLITQEDFMQIKGSPLAYWLGKSFINDLVKLPTLGEFARPRSGLTTGDNERYLRYWYEVEKFNKSIADINYSDKTFDKWVPLNGGSNFRKWYGSNTQVIFWENNGASIRENPAATMANPEFQFKHGVTWSKITGTDLSVRKTDTGFVFSAVGLKAFPPEESINYVCGFLNSSLVKYLVPIFSSNITILSGDIAKYPLKETSNPLIDRNVERLCQISKLDWDSFETSWDFIILQLLDINNIKPKLKNTYCILRARWQEITKEMKQLEKENNQIFIESYELQNELASEVTLDEITLTCNPYYRYNHNKTEEELEALLLADTMKEFISYAVGCMFGRYSLEKPGLVLANQGEGIAEFRMQIAEWKKIQNSEFKIQNLTFEPDEDNVIPVLDGEWFEDDIVERFKKFLRVTFGDEHYEENLAFIEKAIGRDVRSYFVKEFYKDHVQTYKKRPIYWLFSSPKGSFNALIYMHRYQPDTVSIVLNGYLREYIKKLNAHKAQLERTSVSGSASQSQKTKALKEISQINKALSELKEYESEVLYPLAMEQVRIDLDDGVKINYGKFGAALNPIKGL